MKIYEVKERTELLVEQLLMVWEESVRATHDFLSGEEMEKIKGDVPQALKGVQSLVIAVNGSGVPVGFMGVEDHRPEMLFLASGERGKGLGKQLLLYGIQNYGIQELTVNEQNPQAVGFYEHMGFETYKRTDVDEEGGPYPLLYMKRNHQNEEETEG